MMTRKASAGHSTPTLNSCLLNVVVNFRRFVGRDGPGTPKPMFPFAFILSRFGGRCAYFKTSVSPSYAKKDYSPPIPKLKKWLCCTSDGLFKNPGSERKACASHFWRFEERRTRNLLRLQNGLASVAKSSDLYFSRELLMSR